MVDWLNHQLKLYVKQKWTYVSNRLSSINNPTLFSKKKL